MPYRMTGLTIGNPIAHVCHEGICSGGDTDPRLNRGRAGDFQEYFPVVAEVVVNAVIGLHVEPPSRLTSMFMT